MRHWIEQFGLTLLLAIALCPFGRATEGAFGVALKDKALVRGDAILLSDIATLTDAAPDDMRQLAISNAPTPGHGRKVSRMLVKVRMISSGCDMSRVTFSGSDVCDVSVPSACVTPAEVVNAARKHLASYFPAGGDDVEIDLANTGILRDMNPVRLPAGANPPELRATVPQGTPTPGNVRVDVEIVHDDAVIRKIPVYFALKLYRQVVVAQKAISAGQKLTPENIALSRRELSAVHGACYESIDAAAGMVASVALQPAQVISDTTVRRPEAPIVIEANQNVFLVVQTETLKVVTLGKALARARRGEVARARNLATGREVVGVAGDDSAIHVLLGGPSNGQ